MNPTTSQEKHAPIPADPGERLENQTASPLSDANAGFETVRAGCAVYDLDSRAKVALTGHDRVRWLNGMITNKIRDLEPGAGVYGFVLNPQGRVLGDLYAYNRGEALLIDTDQAQLQNILTIFDRYIIMDDVEVANLAEELTTVGIAGPKTLEILSTAEIHLPELAPLRSANVPWNGITITAVRSDNSALESYEFWLPPENAASLREALVNAGGTRVGPATLELVRIACGIPRYGQDIRERDLPQETEQLRALHFSKGCYVGQEIVERIRSRGSVHRKFTGFKVHGPLPHPGAKIVVDDKEVGEITSSAILPIAGGERAVALGYIRREVEKPGKELNVSDAKLTIAGVPFAGVFGG
jgi:folate-binding protein YgfZ